MLQSFLYICAFVAFPMAVCAQPNTRIDNVNLTYAADYAPPVKIAFVFTGNPNYVAYYFEYLEPELKKTFGAKNKNVSYHYLDKITEEALSTADAVFVLNVNGAETINERSGHDRMVKHTLQGSLRCKKAGVTLLSFLDVVYTVHDIAAFPKGVAKKLQERLARKFFRALTICLPNRN